MIRPLSAPCASGHQDSDSTSPRPPWDLPSKRPGTPPGRFFIRGSVMLKVEIKGDPRAHIKRIEQLQKSVIPKVLTTAVNKTAFEVRDALRAEIVRVFDRPVAYTRNSVYVVMAKPTTLVAKVGIKDDETIGTPAAKYLAPQMTGGPRKHKRFEKWLIHHGIMSNNKYAIPGWACPKDSYGNVRPGLYTQILSALGASADPRQNRTARTTRRRVKQRAAEYFVMSNGSGETIGIAKARRGRTGNFGKLQMMFFFGRQPRYSKRFDFAGLTAKVAAREFPRKVDEAISRSLAGTLR